MLGGNERRPEGDAFGKRSFPSEARRASQLLVPQSLPSAIFPCIGYVLYYQVYKLINDGLLDFIKTKAMRGIIRKTFLTITHK